MPRAGLLLVATALAAAFVAGGVRGGIERLTSVVMPVVFAILLGLAAYAVTFAEWDTAVAFLFTPDLSVLADPALWSAAVGQVFFSLSVGQGIMLTYGSYMDEDTDLVSSAVLVTVADVGAAVLAGLVIFPIVFTAGLQPTLGTELAFTTLPAAFEAMAFGRVVAVAFFGLLFFAALSSAVALLEVGVAAAATTTRLNRRRATALLTGGVFLAGVPSALSYSPLDLAVAGRPVLDVVDESVGTYALPVSAVSIAVVFVWLADLEGLRDDLGRLYPLVRYLVPTALVLVTGAKLVGVARPAWRLLVSRVPDGLHGVVVTVAVLTVLLGLGWLLRERIGRARRRTRR